VIPPLVFFRKSACDEANPFQKIIYHVEGGHGT
jgi:hypothetical protein